MKAASRLVINNGPDAGEAVPHLHMHLLAGRKLEWASRLGRSGISAAGGREGMCHSCPFPGMVPPCLLVRRGVCL